MPYFLFHQAGDGRTEFFRQFVRRRRTEHFTLIPEDRYTHVTAAWQLRVYC
jgi:hypothetical protein